MALRGVLTHHKTLHLAELLDIAPCFAVGILESMWHKVAEQTPTGAIGRMSNAAIRAVIGYPGDADRLVSALVEAGFLDEHPNHRLIIHNWHQRRDNDVDARLYRTGQRYANGSLPVGSKLTKKIKAEAFEKFWKTPASSLFAVPTLVHEERPDAQSSGVLLCAAQSSYPEPEPDPEPEPEQVSSAHSSGGSRALVQASQDVLLHCSVTGTSAADLQSSICAAIESECRRVEKPPEEHADTVAKLMIANYQEYVRVGPALEFRWKLKRFFEEGHWRNWQNWPIDRERERQIMTANVGVVQ